MSVKVEDFKDLPNPVKISMTNNKAVTSYYKFCTRVGVEMYDSYMQSGNTESDSYIFFGFDDPDHSMMFKLEIS